MTNPRDKAMDEMVERLTKEVLSKDVWTLQDRVTNVLNALTPADLATLVDALDSQGRIAFDLCRQETIRKRADEAIAARRVEASGED